MSEYQQNRPNDDYRQAARFQETAPLSAMAVTALVLGVIALLTSFLPIINNVSFLLALLGAVFGIVAAVATIRGTRRGKPLAVSALVLNIVAFAVVLATQAMFSAAIDEALSGASDATADAPASDTSQQATQREPEQRDSKYTVSIDDCTVTTDYSGASAIVVTYTFTNDSDKAVPFMTAISAKAFQNGVQLDAAIVEDIDAQSTVNEIKSGATTTVQKAYVLDDESEVSVECTELFSFNDTIIAEKTFAVV